MSVRNVNVVLVHGAWTDGSSWSKVIDRLHAHGVQATAAALPLSSLQDDVNALDRTLERIDEPVVLVAHAYAGAVIGATRDGRVKALVYVAALVPDDGETVADVFYRGETHPQAPKLEPDRHGLIWLPRDAFGAAVAQDATPDELNRLASTQRPIAVPSISEAVGRPRWRDTASWYLIAERDRMISPTSQHFMARRMNASVRSYDVDHTPNVTAPDAVTTVVMEAVRSVAASASN